MSRLDRRLAPTTALLVVAAAMPWAAQAAPAPDAAEGVDRGGEDPIAAYCRRAAEVRPDDAGSWHELGLWCREHGLEERAVAAFRQAVALDPDHAGARRALGHVRHGPGWREAGSPGESAGEAKVAEAAEAGPSGTGAPDEGSAASPARRDPEAGAGTGPGTAPGAAAGKGDADIETAAARAVREKKAWAERAAETFRSEFATLETEDWLIHTTFPSARHAKVRELLGHLESAKRLLLGYLGLRGSHRPWPDKLQFVLLRSPQEFERFADIVDGVPDAVDPEGAYVADRGHVALWRPQSVLVLRHVGDTALEWLDGSRRPVGWWLAEGASERVVADLMSRRDEGAVTILADNFIRAADAIRARDEETLIYSLLETPGYRSRERGRQRALAMTLVDFLRTQSARGLGRLVERLKGEDAPPPPAPDSEDARKSWFLSYLAYQQESIETLFRTSVDKLERAWKAWVLQRAEAFRSRSRN